MELIHVSASNEELMAEALILSERRAQTYVTNSRKEQLTILMDRIFFELNERQKEGMQEELIPMAS